MTIHDSRISTRMQNTTKPIQCDSTGAGKSSLPASQTILPIHTNYIHHRLRGSAINVLAATCFVNGKGQFSTHSESTSLNRSPKIVTGDYVGDTYNCAKLSAHPSTGLLGTWVKYNQNYFIYALFGNSPTGQTVDGFSRMMADSRKDVRLWELFALFPI